MGRASSHARAGGATRYAASAGDGTRGTRACTESIRPSLDLRESWRKRDFVQGGQKQHEQRVFADLGGLDAERRVGSSQESRDVWAALGGDWSAVPCPSDRPGSQCEGLKTDMNRSAYIRGDSLFMLFRTALRKGSPGRGSTRPTPVADLELSRAFALARECRRLPSSAAPARGRGRRAPDRRR